MRHRPAQFAEETKRADKNVAYGLITSTLVEAAMGLAFVLAFLFCLPVRLSLYPHDAGMTGTDRHLQSPDRTSSPCV